MSSPKGLDYESPVKGKIVIVIDHEPGENDPNSIFDGRSDHWPFLNNARAHRTTDASFAGPPHGMSGSIDKSDRIRGV